MDNNNRKIEQILTAIQMRDSIVKQSIAKKLEKIDKKRLEIELKGNFNDEIIESYLFVGFKNCTRMVLANKKIKNILPHAFQGLESLNDLDLSNNNIVQIDPECFQHVQTLRKIQFRANRINSIDDLVFSESLSNLTQINLEENVIPRIGEKTFMNLFHLQLLYLSKNKIEIIHNEAFSTLKSLLLISLKDNKLRQIYVDQFRGLTELREIYLHGNEWINSFDMNCKIRLFLEPKVKQVTLNKSFFSEVKNDMEYVQNTVIN